MMISKNRILIASATLVLAAGVGYAKIDSDYIVERFSTTLAFVAYASADTAQPKQTILKGFLPALPTEAILPASLPAPDNAGALRVAALTTAFDTTLQSDVPTPTFFTQDCDVDLTALPEAGAMVRLQLSAPCYQNQRITVRHAGLEFADNTTVDGSYSVEIPAMNAFAPFTIGFADGRSVEAKTLKLSLDGYQRVAISWSGAPVLHVHAMEFGASFGEVGHVWADARNAPRNRGGQLFQLGNPDVFLPILAEVYSVAGDSAAQEGGIDLLVEAEVNALTCGRNVQGRAFQLTGDGNLTSTGIAFSLPLCGGEYGFLQLNNLFHNMVVASN